MEQHDKGQPADVILIGAGVISATLGVMLTQLDPALRIETYERLSVAAAESSDAWNNAGTGHSAFCELNYTPELPDGSIDIKKALTIAQSFEESKEFWAFLLKQGILPDAKSFINPVPHCSFVWGQDNVNYLRKRYNALIQNQLFAGMEFSEDREVLKQWFPLIMEHRDEFTPVAATRMKLGTDVNFGALSRAMFNYLGQNHSIYYRHDVVAINRNTDGTWQVVVKDLNNGHVRVTNAKFVMIGAGGGSLPLLLKTGIPEAQGFGGFPVSGQWLRCKNEAIINKHAAKVYGKATVGSPPMSDPHLDTRIINGKRELLFGPYAGFSTKFLKQGSFFDLPGSVRLSNLRPMVNAGLDNLALVKYLVEQVTQSPKARVDNLRRYMPDADIRDWELEHAGQRVQVIRKDANGHGVLAFGTEVVTSADGSIAALLGASPGASTAVSIMVNVIEKCFTRKAEFVHYGQKLKELIPSYGQSLVNNAQLVKDVRAVTTPALGLQE